MILRPARKMLGQHFLVDRRAVEQIIRALDPRAGEPLLEIGPGRGVLTERLIGEVGRIAAVEIDRRLATALRERFPPAELALFEEDVLGLHLAAVLERLGGRGRDRLTLVGNLPYSISKPIAQKLIRERGIIDRAVLMFQREVAMRLTAAPGTRSYGPLTVLAGQAFEIEPLFDLSPAAFRPRPKVDSTLTRWRRKPAPLTEEMEARLRPCLAACFARRRRTLRNNLRAALENDRAVETLLQIAGLEPSLRAEAVPPAGFLRLAAAWPGVRSPSGD